MNVSQLIAFLNSITVGDLDSIHSKLETARHACLELDQTAISDTLGEAAAALSEADLKTYRKRLATVIAKLGHLR